MVRIKRIYDPPSPGDGKRIYIDRLWPRGLKKNEAMFDEWMKEVSPSNALRKWFGHDPFKWQEFKIRRVTITLLYSAKDAEHNNAVVMKEMIE